MTIPWLLDSKHCVYLLLKAPNIEIVVQEYDNNTHHTMVLQQGVYSEYLLNKMSYY